MQSTSRHRGVLLLMMKITGKFAEILVHPGNFPKCSFQRFILSIFRKLQLILTESVTVYTVAQGSHLFFRYLNRKLSKQEVQMLLKRPIVRIIHWHVRV
jgi:hypothetical protein